MEKNRRPSMENFVLLLFSSSMFSIFVICIAVDIIATDQFITDGETIVSSGGNFELGFFSPGKSKNRYVGIWYKKISVKTVVWVANREIPVTNASGVLKVIQPGILALFNGTNSLLWSSNTSRSSSNPVAQLLDSGNLVVKEAHDDYNPENFLWQSFDYPGDTFLAGMKLGKNFVTGLDWYSTSWKSTDDPAPGDFTLRCYPHGYPQFFLSKGSVEVFRTGPWNGLRFSGAPNLRENEIYRFGFVFNEKEVSYSFELKNSSVITRFLLDTEGASRRWIWIDRTQTWVPYLSAQIDNCDLYKLCGAHGSCNVANSPACQCLNKFQPKYPNEWEMADWSNGCVRRQPLNCQTDGFLKYSDIKLPDTRNSLFNRSMSLQECQAVCLKNCSCMAYSNLDIRNGGSGCLLWFGDLLDIREFPENGQDIYIRLASSELALQTEQSGSNKKKRYIITVTLPVLVGMVLLGLCLFFYARRKRSQAKREGRQERFIQQDYSNESQKEDLELPMLDLSTVAKATNNFSINNKLGEGGFGPVYRGVLEDRQEIAVKRLSESSRQGQDEFRNEVICIAKLQHRNLVKLLGCCIQGEEKILIYEYMPNKSLDSFIFDEARRGLLDWPTRFHIINGIARGLLYLHEDSRLRVIHRDLKASNILLDVNMNPKISDFGLARSFAENETKSNTKRVVGTYGYMSPEYAVDGLFSLKSDVFSFGVLVLEIVSGERNKGFIHKDHNHNLLGHAWRLFKEERSMELIDSSLSDSCCLHEALRSIHVGLLCVQQSTEDRPNMSSVVLMLGSEDALPSPKEPGFFTERSILRSECSSSMNAPSSIDENTITILEAR